ncbi:hypothetical protein [Halalkalibacter alkaliphilus]|uniref:Uncharacterized protein n=1 Tax=Halalkalibacter alkaliphilus TaxID=2917993 RepID=A0A9X2CWF8_9BACI|nr:hypothetical protein [Halalkalibacter alkaliphilus]MCL7749592.1 hypothetical protein [Halalkalibacter alkaliphilus]
MNIFFDVSWQLFHFLLIGILIIGVTVMLRYFIKNKFVLLGVMVTLILGTIFVIDQTKYTTFKELFSEHLNEENEVRSISIAVNDLSGDRPETVARTTIDDDSLINDILKDFEEIKLKKDEDVRFLSRRYTIGITANKEIRENFSKTTTKYIEIDDKYLDEYRIITNANHLKTIESLVE